MVRTQIYLTEEEREELTALGKERGKGQSELIREAVDNFIRQFSNIRRDSVLDDTAGIWKGRRDLPDFSGIRKEWDRK